MDSLGGHGRPDPPRFIIFILGFLAMTGSLSVNMYLPALADMADDIGVGSSAAQFTITASLLGLATGQLVLGPLSDRSGRRKVLVMSTVLFTVSSIVIVPVSDIWLFCALRLVQGFAAAGGMAVSRAVAADLTDGPAATRALSLIAMCVALGPVISPVIGGFLTEVVGWRGVFAVLGVVGVTMTVLCWLWVPDSLPEEERRVGGVGATVRSFSGLLKDRSFTAAMIAYSAGFTCYMAYVAASPFVAQGGLGMSPAQFSIAFAFSAVALISANLLNASLSTKTRPDVMLLAGNALTVCASVMLLLVSLAGGWSIALFVGLAFILCFGSGLISANSTVLGFSRASGARGSGAALMGVMQFLVGGLVTPLAGFGGGESGVPMGMVGTAAAAVALVAGIILVRTRR